LDMKRTRWLLSRPGWVTPDIAVFKDPNETEMYSDKPVEVRVDAESKTVYVWMKVPGYSVQTEAIGGALDGFQPEGGPSIPPWPDEA
jgi:hypothetical protein